MSKVPRFLIVDGYSVKGREQFNQVGMRLAGVFVCRFIGKIFT
jgi:GMP synthase (glutamine-hydrolysing)